MSAYPIDSQKARVNNIKPLEEHNIKEYDFLEEVTTNGFISYKHLQQFCKRYIGVVDFFTIKLGAEWYKIEIEDEGFYLSLHRALEQKHIRKSYVTFGNIQATPVVVE